MADAYVTIVLVEPTSIFVLTPWRWTEINSYSESPSLAPYSFSTTIHVVFLTRHSYSQVGMAIGYIVLTVAYYKNSFNGRNLDWMSTSLFGSDGSTYNQSAILTPENTLDPAKLAQVGLPRYTTTYTISQMCYNFSLGAAVVHVLLWHWGDLKRGEASGLPSHVCMLSERFIYDIVAFGQLRFLKNSDDIDDPHYQRGFFSSCSLALLMMTLVQR